MRRLLRLTAICCMVTASVVSCSSPDDREFGSGGDADPDAGGSGGSGGSSGTKASGGSTGSIGADASGGSGGAASGSGGNAAAAGSSGCATEVCGSECCASADAVCFNGSCCVPDCAGKQCGSDACGGECTPGCKFNEQCAAAGSCGVRDGLAMTAHATLTTNGFAMAVAPDSTIYVRASGCDVHRITPAGVVQSNIIKCAHYDSGELGIVQNKLFTGGSNGGGNGNPWGTYVQEWNASTGAKITDRYFEAIAYFYEFAVGGTATTPEFYLGAPDATQGVIRVISSTANTSLLAQGVADIHIGNNGTIYASSGASVGTISGGTLSVTKNLVAGEIAGELTQDAAGTIYIGCYQSQTAGALSACTGASVYVTTPDLSELAPFIKNLGAVIDVGYAATTNELIVAAGGSQRLLYKVAL
jgi:hypothetical protein